MEIALFGGSFNPVHLGHVLVCAQVLSTEPVGEIWMMPAFIHPFGKQLAPFADRVEMCRLATEPFSGRVRVSEVERELKGEGRTVDTLEHLARTMPTHRLALILGADVLAERTQWKAWERIEQLARVIPVGRAGYAGPGLALPEVSSTLLRERLQRGEDCASLAPRSVLAYAAARELYQHQ